MIKSFTHFTGLIIKFLGVLVFIHVSDDVTECFFGIVHVLLNKVMKLWLNIL